MYYDYDFQEMVSELEELNGTNSQILTEVKAMHKEQTEFIAATNGTLTFMSIILVLTVAVKVMFK